MTICENMFKIMKAKNLHAADLCKILNVQTATTTNWKKRNTDPPAKYLATICEFLDVSLEELLGIQKKGLTPDAQEMLNKYNLLPHDKKELALTMLRGLAKDYESTQEMPTQKEA